MTDRIRAAWNVLRGRQTIYRCPSMTLAEPIELERGAVVIGRDGFPSTTVHFEGCKFEAREDWDVVVGLDEPGADVA